MRCKPTNPSSSVLVARGEPFCGPCFHRFLSTKFRKQTEDYKVAYTKSKVHIESRKHVIIPILSFPLAESTSDDGDNRKVLKDAWPYTVKDMGSSFALIDLVVDMIKEQKTIHRGKRGLYLHIVEITIDTKSQTSPNHRSQVLELLEERYKGDEILSYSEFSLLTETLTLYSFEHLGTHDSETPKKPLLQQKIDTQIASTLLKLPTRSSRADALVLAIRNLIPKIGETLYSFSSSSELTSEWKDLPKPWDVSQFVPETVEAVAQQILASMAKGRMNLIYSDMLASDSSRKLFQIWPLKDIRSTEIEQFLEREWPEASFFISASDSIEAPKKVIVTAAAKKNMSIDSLIKSYFNEIEASFPSVATTVVRTTEKLADPGTVLDDPQIGELLRRSNGNVSNEIEKFTQCAVCGCQRNPNTLSWSHKITVNEAAAVEEDEPLNPESDSNMNSIPEKQHNPLLDSLCYGCLVMLKDSTFATEKNENSEDLQHELPNWKTDYEIQSRGNSLNNVLAEYEL